MTYVYRIICSPLSQELGKENESSAVKDFWFI